MPHASATMLIPHTPGEEGMRDQVIIEGIYKAAASGRNGQGFGDQAAAQAFRDSKRRLLTMRSLACCRRRIDVLLATVAVLL